MRTELVGAGQEKGQEVRRDDCIREMGHLSSALPEMVTAPLGKLCWDTKNGRGDGSGEEKPQSSKTMGAKSSSEGQKCGERMGDGAGAERWAQGIWGDFQAPECSG